MRIPVSTTPAKVVFVLMVMFLAAQAFSGEQGILKWRLYSVQSDELAREKAKLVQEREELERQVALLRNGSASSDYVEELAIKKLGMVGENDVVVRVP